MRKILVTCALPYANGEIHLGHSLEHIEADIWVRFQRMRGNECRFFCADDTHGTPVMITSRQLGISPEELIKQKQIEHQRDLESLHIQYDNYSSTNSEENRLLCEEIFAAMKNGGHIDVRSIDQLYSEKDKMFLPDRFIKGTCPRCKSPDQYGDSCDNCGSTYSPTEMIDARSAISGDKLVLRKSEHLFFKLNDYRDFLREWVPLHTAEEVSKKMGEWLKEDLRDWDISRDEPYFGFAIPGHPGKFFYVWVDAPIGYISTSWQWCKKNNLDFKSYWKDSSTEIHHFIGKDIVYFHTLFWPAMLKSAGYSQPKQVHVHGFVTVNGEKMSKSKGTYITAKQFSQNLDPNYLRYYYACKLSGRIDDIDLNLEDLINRVNSDLIGKIINLGSRSAQMLGKKLDGKLGTIDGPGGEILKRLQASSEKFAQFYEEKKYSHLINEIRGFADEANRYFDQLEPWKLLKEKPEETRQILTSTLNIFRVLVIYLKPVIPSIAQSVAALFGENDLNWQALLQTKTAQSLGEFKHLAERVDPLKIQALQVVSN